MYAFTQVEVETGTSTIVAGQISIAHTLAYILINSSASHLFVSTSFTKKMDIVPELLDDVCNISLPSREKLTSWFSFKVKLVKISGRELSVDLIVLE